MRSVIVAIAILLTPAVWAEETTLAYDAFVGNAKVGEAQVRVHRDESTYAISGKAWTVGVFKALTQWQSLFMATGRFSDQTPMADGYRFIESAKDKLKELLFSDGALTYFKNGEVRAKRPLASVDLLSALFASRDCTSAGAAVHDGKDQYTLRLTARETLQHSSDGATERCRFELSDRDDERIDATIRLTRLGNLTVPVRLDLSGAIEGTLKLQSTSLVAFTPNSSTSALPL